jgi:hypothetical protein
MPSLYDVKTQRMAWMPSLYDVKTQIMSLITFLRGARRVCGAARRAPYTPHIHTQKNARRASRGTKLSQAASLNPLPP